MSSKIAELQKAFQVKTKKFLIFNVAFVLSLSSLSLFVPKNGTFAEPSADETIMVHIVVQDSTRGSYTVEYNTDDEEELAKQDHALINSGTFSVPAGNQMTLTAISAEGYTFVGWYNTHEDDSDGQGTMIWVQDDQLTDKPSYTFTPTAPPYPYLMPVFAESSNQFDPSNYATIEIGGGATNISEADGDDDTVTVTFENGNITVTGNNLYSNTIITERNTYEVYALGDVVITANPNAGYNADLMEDGSPLGKTTRRYNDLEQGDNRRIDGQFSMITNDVTANIVVSAGEGTYSMNRQNPETGEVEQIDTEYDSLADFFINNTMWEPGSSTLTYPSNPDDETVDFKFETLWNQRYYDKIIINNEPYTVSEYLDFEDRTEWLNANKGSQVVSFTIPGVAKADTYNIVVKHGLNNHKTFLSTFLWTADPAQADGDNYIGHSKLEFVRAEYEVGETEYTVTAEDLAPFMRREGEFDTANSEDGFMAYGTLADVDFDDGNLTVPGNARVTMRVVPDYGYQVTSVNNGGDFTTTDEGVSEFTVVLPEGVAGYFQAEVTAVDDEVIATSDKVTGGSITIADGDIDSGTVRLSVDDVELSADKIKNFADAVGENYNISTYLDINLDKVLYRGNSEDVWADQIHQLDNEAVITLQLEEGIDANSIVIVHNIDDGDEYEIIEIDSYDPETNTITFRTKSFSNYAIASNVSSPDTGIITADKSVIVASSSFVVALIILSFTVLLAIKKRQTKQ